MAYLLGVDTGGTYTDAVILDEATDTILASAKALTSRPDLAVGVGAAIDAALSDAGINPADVAMVSLSTTLATNALVEGQGGRIALVFIGFNPADLGRGGLTDALRGDPVISLAGGHSYAGMEVVQLDLRALEHAVRGLDAGVTGFAIAASFATRNASHEITARDLIRDLTGKPVTCSHELSSALGGPKRALTAVLNARLIGMIDGLISACEGHLIQIGIHARLMVVRGDGALVSADVAREKPIETILSGPAASIAGASWLTGEQNALVSDIGGTTTDVCLLHAGRPKIDPQGARVGPYRTMVEAVAIRTTGLGGDSEVHVVDGVNSGLWLGPRRLMPISLAAQNYPELVHKTLDQCLSNDAPLVDAGQFAIPMFTVLPQGLDAREQTVATRLLSGPMSVSDAAITRIEKPALMRLVTRGMLMIAGVTPSDASHVLGRVDVWDKDAATKALALFGRRRTELGDFLATGPKAMAQMVVDQLTKQTVNCLLQTAFDEDGWMQPELLAAHPLTMAGLNQHRGVVQIGLKLGVPVIGLGASAAAYYGAVGERLNTRIILPKHAGVANAIGAIVGQVAMHASGVVTSQGAGSFIVHLAEGINQFLTSDEAMAMLEEALTIAAGNSARAAGVEEIRFAVARDIKQVNIEGQMMFIEASVKVTAQGRPRIAAD